MRSAAALVLASALCVSACAHNVLTSGADTPKDAAQATDFSLRSTEGRTVRLSDYLGKDVVLLSFWATWCSPCLGEMPELEKLHQRYKDQGLTILGISMDGPESVANVDSTLRRYGVSYPVLLDEETRVASLYDPTKDAPFTVLIGRNGRVVESHLGYSPGDELKLEQQIKTLLAAQ